jgi:F0F1-type ATP synthase beta subunit
MKRGLCPMLDNENTVKAEGLQKVTRRAHSHESNVGTVTSIRGSVIDVKFLDHLPSLNRLLKTGENDGVVIEVMNHLDSKTVRGIALTTTPGLAHGAAVIDTRLPPKVPVGRRLLGRISLQFGAAPYFGIVNIRRKDKEIEKQDIIENPHRSVETAKGIRVAE